MHILMLPASYPRFYKPLSGIFYRDQVLALHRSGVTVGVIDPSPRAARTAVLGGVSSQRFQITSGLDEGVPVVQAHDWSVPFFRRLYAQQFLWRTNDLFQRYERDYGQPDVIHAQETLWAGIAAEKVSQRTGIPYVVTEHSSEYRIATIPIWAAAQVRASLDRAASVVTVSSDLGNRLRKFCQPREMEVVPNVVDTEFFSFMARPAGSTPFLFASVASQILDKGIDVLLRAFALGFAGRADVRLEIGGDGPDRSSFEALADELGVRRQVHWLGALTRDQVRSCLHRADAFVLPSRHETFGVVFIEAMSTGLPVVATRCGGPEDFVNTETGRLVGVDNVDETADAMRDVVQSRAEWSDRGRAIHNYTVERFSQAAVSRQLCTIYDGAIRRGVSQ